MLVFAYFLIAMRVSGVSFCVQCYVFEEMGTVGYKGHGCGLECLPYLLLQYVIYQVCMMAVCCFDFLIALDICNCNLLSFFDFLLAFCQ